MGVRLRDAFFEVKMNPVVRLKVMFVGVILLAWVVSGCDDKPIMPPVVHPDADSLAVSPDSATIRAGTSFTFTVAAFDSTGAPIVANLAFASSNTSVFTVSALGRAFGESEGVATLIVTSGTARDSAVVTVTPAERGWFAQTSGAAGTKLNGVFFLGDGRRGWIAGDGGKILRSTDGGDSWTTQSSTTAVPLQAVWFTNDSLGWAVGNGGTVRRTTNGRTWTFLSVPAGGENLNDVHFATADTGWIVGSNGLILRTFNRGVTWTVLRPTNFDLRSVSFANTRDGWVVGDNGTILGTSDGGRSWYTVLPLVTTSSLRAVWRRSVARANAVGLAGVAPRTVAVADSAAWLLENVGNAYELLGTCFPTEAVGFAVGANVGGAILRSTDGGATWTPQVANTVSRLNCVIFIDTQHGWAVGDNGAVMHTVTGGEP